MTPHANICKNRYCRKHSLPVLATLSIQIDLLCTSTQFPKQSCLAQKWFRRKLRLFLPTCNVLEHKQELSQRLHSTVRTEANFSLLHQWTTSGMTAPPNESKTSIIASAALQNSDDANFQNYRLGDSLKDDDSYLQVFVVHPHSVPRFAWVIISGLICGWDIITIPLEASGIIPGQDVMQLLTTAFWTLDIVCTFFIGLEVSVVFELRPRKLARHYCTTWLGPDLFVLSLDWLLVLLGGLSGLDQLRLARALRLLRLARMMRLRKLIEL